MGQSSMVLLGTILQHCPVHPAILLESQDGGSGFDGAQGWSPHGAAHPPDRTCPVSASHAIRMDTMLISFP